MKIATLVIITQGNKILLGLKRNGCEIGDGTLNGPGGKLDPGETLLEGVIRETKEETTVILNPAKIEKCAIVTFYAAGASDFEVHVYRANEFSGEPHETETMIPAWYDIEPLPVKCMLESDLHWFPQLVRGEKFNANVYYREKAKGFIRIEFFPFIDSD